MQAHAPSRGVSKISAIQLDGAENKCRRLVKAIWNGIQHQGMSVKLAEEH